MVIDMSAAVSMNPELPELRPAKLHAVFCYILNPWRRGADRITWAVHFAMAKLHQGYMSTTRGLNP